MHPAFDPKTHVDGFFSLQFQEEIHAQVIHVKMVASVSQAKTWCRLTASAPSSVLGISVKTAIVSTTEL